MFALDPADRIRDGLVGVSAEDRRSWSGSAPTERLLELRALQEQLDGEMVRCVADWEAAAAWAEGSALRTHVVAGLPGTDDPPGGRAARHVARLVREHEGTAAALVHVQVISSARARLDASISP